MMVALTYLLDENFFGHTNSVAALMATDALSRGLSGKAVLLFYCSEKIMLL